MRFVALVRFLALVALMAPAVARADVAPPPPPTAPAASRPAKNPRVACGCPTARFLTRGPISLNDGKAVAAWLHDGAHVEPFGRDETKKLVALESDLRVDELSLDGEHVPSSSRLVRLSGTFPDGSWLGMLRRNEVTPKDFIEVKSTAPPPQAKDGPPVLSAMWIAALEERERAGCGVFVTHRLAFETREGSPPPEAFLVKDVQANISALVDARAVGAYGIGRVEVCEQGLPIRIGEYVTLEIRPVSSSFGVGDPWRFYSDGTGTTDPHRSGTPASADKDRIKEPFPIPGADGLKGPTAKELGMLVMGTAVGTATIVAFIMFVVIPARKRRMKDIACPSCGKHIPFDSLDPKTDGFFCPSCGASGFWKKGTEVDVKDLRAP